MALNAYSLSRCVNAERKTKKGTNHFQMRIFPLCLRFFLGCLSPRVIRQEREEWTSFIKLKYALCSLFSLLQDCPPPCWERRKHRMNVGCGKYTSSRSSRANDRQEGQEGQWKDNCPLVYYKKVWSVCLLSGLQFSCCDCCEMKIIYLDI